MIKQYEIIAEIQNKNLVGRPSYFWGYVLYSALLEKFDEEFCEAIHRNEVNVINHYIAGIESKYENGILIKYELVWRVNVIGEEAIEKFERNIDCETELIIEKYNATIKIKDIRCNITFEEKSFAKRFLEDEPPNRIIDIRFVTPTSFKTEGMYEIFPNESLIIKSAVQKWNMASEQYSFDELEIIEQIIENIKIVKYNLKSQKYYLKGIGIPSFVGYVQISMRGPQALISVASMLIHYLEFTGCGMKTSLGMGGIKIGDRDE